nr:hypothetical protein [Actinomycetota bacterium]
GYIRLDDLLVPIPGPGGPPPTIDQHAPAPQSALSEVERQLADINERAARDLAEFNAALMSAGQPPAKPVSGPASPAAASGDGP